MPIVKAETFDYEVNKKYLEAITREYPFVSAEVISRTSLGRGIFSLTVGNRNNSVLLAGGFHGCEWVGCLTLYKFIEQLCFCLKYHRLMSDVDISRAYTQLGVTVIPCVNPDGTEIAVHGPASARSLRKFVESIPCDDYSKWNANAMGVDINHNFNAGWEILRRMEEENGISSPSARQYGGEHPESEAETKALTRLCRSRSFRQVMAIHSQGEELYWQYGKNTPAQASMIAKILADSCSYSLINNDGLASHGGFKDWFIEQFSRPGFTLEIGKGENPLPATDMPEIYERIEEALTIFTLM
ncbi:MAG: gamma-D-glutamyl-meso-diaminopimelate peptidase [Ruminococcus sp.]|nr:gamma-D-glutamyl-meso-diaminopimelate peptidase [Ruminococcus sp.]